MKSTVASLAAFAGATAAQQGYGSAQTTTYACNPAHQYPASQVCTEIGGSLTLVEMSATAPGSSAPSASATYACNPAHQYPTGQVCTEIGGSLTLISTSETAPGYSTPFASATYACNPAHQYPEGQVCTTIGGSLTLVSTSSTAAAGYPTPTTSSGDNCQDEYKTCIAAGTPVVKCSCDLTACLGEDSARIRDYCSSATASLSTYASATLNSYTATQPTNI